MKDALQQQYIETRRSQILDAAISVFSEKGFHAATIKDIARRAGIADGTIYNYFKSKDGILIGVFERMRQTVQANVDLSALHQVDLETFLRTLFQYTLVATPSDPSGLFRVVASEMMFNETLRASYYTAIVLPTIEMGQQVIQQWAAQQGRRLNNPALTTHVIAGMVLGLMLMQSVDDPIITQHLTDLPDFITTLLLKGIEG